MKGTVLRELGTGVLGFKKKNKKNATRVEVYWIWINSLIINRLIEKCMRLNIVSVQNTNILYHTHLNHPF